MTFFLIRKSCHFGLNHGFVIHLVGCFTFNGTLRQYFSLYRAVSHRKGDRGEKGKMRVKMSTQPIPAPTASAVDPCSTTNQIVGRPDTERFPRALAPHFIAGRPKAALLFWFFGGFRCGVPLFIVMLVIY